MRRLLMVVMGEVAVVALTQRLAHPHWSTLRADPGAVWQAPAGDLVLMVVHLAAWLAAWWLLVGTGHDLVVVFAELRRGKPGRSSRLSPSWVQRILHRAVGTMLVMGVMAGPAGAVTGASEAPHPDVVQVVAPPVPIVGVPPTAAADQSSGVAAPQDPPATAQPTAAPTEEDLPHANGDVHVVATGENLWVIARQHLSVANGSAPTDREVHARWLQLIQDNRDVLRSGDPDVIFPGERLRLGVGATVEVGAGASSALPSDGGGTADDAPDVADGDS